MTYNRNKFNLVSSKNMWFNTYTQVLFWHMFADNKWIPETRS